MDKNLRWRAILIAVVIALSLLYISPSFVGEMPEEWKGILPFEKVHFGLDLQGGMHLVLGVNVNKANEQVLARSAGDVIRSLSDKKITVSQSHPDEGNLYAIRINSPEDRNRAKTLIKTDFPNLRLVEKEGGEATELYVELKTEEIQYIKEHVVQQALETIRNRIDQFGVAEPLIQRQGMDQIVIQLPGIKDPQRALDIIGKTAQLEFKLVDDYSDIISSLVKDPKALPEGILVSYDTVEDRTGKRSSVPYLWSYDKELLEKFISGKVPETHQVLVSPEAEKGGPEAGRGGASSSFRTYLLRKDTMLSGDTLMDARVRIDTQMGEPYVSIKFNSRGARVFEEITGAHTGERLAIILDDVVYSAPRIKQRISGGNAIIEGNFTEQSAHDLSIVLRAGALPAPVNILQKFTVGPTLGRDSVREGIQAILIGGILVVAFMIIYYRTSGLLADISVILNIIILIAMFSALRATLTLPGIAGIILSMGMGVDSNILNFERIREEIKLGKTPRASVEGGFDKSFVTIIDSHVTTLITAAVLFQFGTGPIKGFAVSLFLGVTINLFTSLICTRFFLDYIIMRSHEFSMKYMEFLHKPSFNFMSKRNFAFAFSGIFVFIGLFALVQVARGKANMGTEFSGGSFLQFQAGSPIPIEDIRHVLVRNDISDASIQDLPKLNKILIKVGTKAFERESITDRIEGILKKEFPNTSLTLETANEVGPAIGKNLRNDAILATVIAMIGILIYIAWRFELVFGIMTAIATFHDVLIILGIIYILDKEINLLIISALLTVAGYSLSDKVVVFDRVRENLRRRGGTTNLSELINTSINEVISRTMITGICTLLAITSMYIFGGIVLRDFSLSLFIGILIGTYSSIFIACSLILVWVGEKGKLFARKT